MRVSVIIPVYNAESNVLSLVKSLSQQTMESFEVLFVDNNSTDATVSVLQKYLGELGCASIHYEKDVQSSYAARNTGVRFARGKWLAFTDADCLPDSNWLMNAVSALERNGYYAGGGRIRMTVEGDVPSLYEYYDSARKLRQDKYILEHDFAATANFFIRKTLIDEVGGFNEKLISGGDFEFGKRITAANIEINYINDAVVFHPARKTFKEILEKTRRVACGERDLIKAGILNQSMITWRRFLPTLRCPVNEQYPSWMTCVRRIQLLLLLNLCRYVNLWRLLH